MNSLDHHGMRHFVIRGALLVMCLSPLIGLGNIRAQNRIIENAGRIQQFRLDVVHRSWRGVQFRLDGANQMLAAARVNEATAIGEASKTTATKEVAKRQSEMRQLEQEAKRCEERIAAQVSSFVPPSQNGRQTILWTTSAMLAAGAVYVLGRRQDITTMPRSAQLSEQ